MPEVDKAMESRLAGGPDPLGSPAVDCVEEGTIWHMVHRYAREKHSSKLLNKVFQLLKL